MLQNLHGAAEAHHALRLELPRGNHALRQIGFIAHLGAMFVIQLADRGYFKLARIALHQPHAQGFFQLADTAADGGFGQIQFTRRRAETTCFHGLGEQVQVV